MVKTETQGCVSSRQPQRVGLVKLKFQSPRPFHGYDITGPWFAQTTATVHKRCHRTFVTGSPIEVSCHSIPFQKLVNPTRSTRKLCNWRFVRLSLLVDAPGIRNTCFVVRPRAHYRYPKGKYRFFANIICK